MAFCSDTERGLLFQQVQLLVNNLGLRRCRTPKTFSSLVEGGVEDKCGKSSHLNERLTSVNETEIIIEMRSVI